MDRRNLSSLAIRVLSVGRYRGVRAVFLSVLMIAVFVSFNLENVAWAVEPSKAEAVIGDRVRARIPDIEVYIASGMKEFDVPGVAIGIVASDKLVWAKGFGMRSKGSGVPVDTRTSSKSAQHKAFLAAT